jgi:hypothetical protein
MERDKEREKLNQIEEHRERRGKIISKMKMKEEHDFKLDNF